MSREIDKLIAEKVFKSKMIKSAFHGSIYFGDENNGGQQPKNYSTNIKDAWEVVEKLKEEMCFSIWIDSGWCEVEVKKFGIDYDQGHNTLAHLEDKSAPMAICNAALRALEN
ncbi:hypothetical protein KAR91_40675 [Candidatus Pacearchaeota archaeon]|nr:hypothetical protein [Candidatus Pacearchaeota archaeon]